MKRNITLLYIIKISKWFMLFMPIVALFYFSNGLSEKELFLLQTVYSVTIVIFEIPSGYVADIISRKFTLIIGSVLGFVGFIFYSTGHDFWRFAIAEICLGIGQSMISGSDSAMLYDSLKDLKQENIYLKHEGRLSSVGNFAESIAAALGGLLAEISLRTPYVFQSVVAFTAIPASFMLINPLSHIPTKKLSVKTFLLAINITFVKNIKLRNRVLLSAVIGASTLTMAWFAQLYFHAVELPRYMFGFLWTTLNLTVGLFSWFAVNVERYFKEKILVWFLSVCIPVSYVVLGLQISYWGIAILFVFYAFRGIATPVLKDYIHKEALSEHRATVLSLRGFIIRVVFSCLAPFVGYLTEKLSLQYALISSGFIFIIVGFILAARFVMLLRVQNVNNV